MTSRPIIKAVVVAAFVLGGATAVRAQSPGQQISGTLTKVDIAGSNKTIEIEWSGRRVLQSVTEKTRVVFHRDPQSYPNPSIHDLKTSMVVHFNFDHQPPERIHVDWVPDAVKQGAPPPARDPGRGDGGRGDGGRGDGGRGDSGSRSDPDRRDDRRDDRRENRGGGGGGGGGSHELMVKILDVDERRGEFQADVAGRKQSFVAENPRDLRRWRVGDLVVVTVERKGGDEVVTAIRAGGLSGRVIDVDRRRGDIRIEVDGRSQTYYVEEKELLEGIRVGDRVRFEIAQLHGRQVITSIH